MTITIRDLARHLNLSTTTVSRALDGYDDVSKATRQRVIEAAADLGYAPSYAARHLRRHQADAIGYLLPTSSPRFSDPFYANFLAGLCDEAANQEMDLIVSSVPADTPEEEALYQRWIQSRRVDGMVLNRTRVVDCRVEILAKNNLPFVTLGCSSSAPDGPHVSVNERTAFFDLVTGLTQKGHRHIAYIGGPANLTIQVEREAGYRAGLAEAGLAVEPSFFATSDLTEQGGYLSALALLSLAHPPTAILGCNDQTALGVLRAAQELGLRVASDLAVAGYDGIQETAYSSPPLTTATQPTYDIARRLVRMLITLIKGKPLEKKEIWIEPEIIWRPSTGPV